MLADAVAPHGGVVMWRAFVYNAVAGEDRAKQAYADFRPLDGKFRKNVMLQVKNGPIDFQPREPFHPLFGQMPDTPLVMEAQITKEYLGFATHLAFLAPLWEEVLDARPTGQASGKTIAASLAESGGLAGVANIGTDRNWSGSHFDQANWYALGRLAWDPTLSSPAIAQEWTRMTWGPERAIVDPVVAMMLPSRQAVVDYMTPFGLHHLMASDHHYGPGPWVDDLERADWNPVYYHRADVGGIGFDRTASGSNAVAQYSPRVARSLADPKTVPEDLLLWFHRVPWDFRTKSGRPLWDELLGRYDRGVATVVESRRSWSALEGRIDPERHAQVGAFLAIQESEARWWRDASIAYWLSIAKRPLPPGVSPPPHDVSWYKARRDQFVPGI
jgi:alpha-glucuronidase